MEKKDLNKGLGELATELIKANGNLNEHVCDETVYRAYDGPSQSDLKVITNRSPLHYLVTRRWSEVEEKPSPALVIGKAMHAAFLEPETFDSLYAIPQVTIGPRNKKAGKDAWKEFAEDNPGKILLTNDQGNIIERMKERLNQIPEIQKYMGQGLIERTFFRRPPDEFPNIPYSLKARMDQWIPSMNTIVDLKTSLSAARGEFTRSIMKFGYYMQDPFYSDMIKELTGEMPRFIFIVIEKTAPYEVGLYELSEDLRTHGRNLYRDGLLTLDRCYRTDMWPGYNKDILKIDVPAWAKKQWEDSLLENLDDV